MAYNKVRQFMMLFFGMAIMSMGVAIAKISTLGTSPISSVPNVMSCITALTIGEWTIIWQVILVVAELVVLVKEFKLANVLQLIPGSFFGLMIDFFVKVFDFLKPNFYLENLVLAFIGVLLLAFGVVIEVNSASMVMPGEGIAIAISYHFKKEFSLVKIWVDNSFVVISVVLALAFLHGLIGVREGTILSALLTGRMVGFYEKYLPKFCRWVQPQEIRH